MQSLVLIPRGLFARTSRLQVRTSVFQSISILHRPFKPFATSKMSFATATSTDPSHYLKTSGATDSVWVHTEPYSNIPTFPKLDKDIETDVCIVGSGISGITIAYELVKQGVNVTMVEARNMLSGESGRTSGHLSADLDDGYLELKKLHGADGAKLAAASQAYAIGRVGEIAKELGIDCEYRRLPAYTISQYPRGTKEHDDEIAEFKEEVPYAKELGLKAEYVEGLQIGGWDGAVDQRDASVFRDQATFHPTKYLNGILAHLKSQPNFQAFSNTRVASVEESGVTIPLIKVHLGSHNVTVKTDSDLKISAAHAVEATAVPLQTLSLIVEQEFMRTYCIALRVPKGVVEDCLVYDQAEAYKYVRLTACDENDDYMIVGGMDHKVGQEGDAEHRYKELENWTRERFTKVGSVDYKWSGQIFEPVDGVGLIGRNSGQKNIYVVTGDHGNGLTHGTLAGKLISDMILGKDNPWEKLYDPSRTMSIVKSLPSMVTHDVQINAQYKRFLQTDIKDIEDLGLGKGGVLNVGMGKPIAVYKDEDGKVTKRSALCPHLKGVVCWNDGEKSWDCPIHGSRFAIDGTQLCGPAKMGLPAADS